MVTELHNVSAFISNLPNSAGLSSNTVRRAEDPSPTTENPFNDLFTDAIGKVNQLEDQARTAVDGFMTGKGVDVHEVMIASEKASMAFEMALAIRNKAVQSYQSVMSMQF